MNAQSDPHLASLCRGLSRASSIGIILLASFVLTGWILDIDALKRVYPAFVSMKANTALAFLAAGLSLLLLQTKSAGRVTVRLGQVGAIVSALLGLLNLAEYLLGWDLGIDQLFFRDVETAPVPPGRMAGGTALDFLLLGPALLLLGSENRRNHLVAQLLSLIAVLPALLAFIGYLYSVQSLYLIGQYGSMAVHTSFGLLTLCVGVLLARPESGFMAVVTSDSPGGLMVRRLAPAVVVAPPVLGWLVLIGYRAGYYDGPLALVLSILANIIVFALLMTFAARSLQLLDLKRKQAEAAASQLASIVQSSNDAIVGKTLDGAIQTWNTGAERLFGYTADEAIGQPVALMVPPDRHDEFQEVLARISRGEHVENYETVRLCKDGIKIDVLSTASPIKDAGGNIVGVSTIAHDITRRKRAEEERERLLQEVERLAQEAQSRASELDTVNKELEAFAYSVSHDLRAPLRHIDGFSQALLEDFANQLDERGKEYLQFIHESTDTMAQLIDDMLKLSRVTRAEMRRETVDLTALAQSIATELQTEQPERRVEFICAPGVTGNGDPRLLRIALENLLSNAWKFTSKRANARVEFTVSQQEGKAVYCVRDNGAGFDMAYAGKLFGAFQRLHRTEEYPGTGVGLATVQRIIRRHGGRVWAESAVDKGTTFYFTVE